MRPYQNVKGMLVAVAVCVALGLMAQPAPAYVIHVLDQSSSCSARAYYSIGDAHEEDYQTGETYASAHITRASAAVSVGKLMSSEWGGYTDYMEMEFRASGHYDGGSNDVMGSAGFAVEATGEFTLQLVKTKGDVSDRVTIPFQTYLRGGKDTFIITLNNERIAFSPEERDITLKEGLNTFKFNYHWSPGSGGYDWMGYSFGIGSPYPGEPQEFFDGVWGFIGFWPEGIYITTELPPAAPLPGTILLLGTGLAGLALQRWRRRPGKD